MTPIMLCGQGRSGTTALMKLFSSSELVFSDREYPYEKRYLTYFAKLSELLARRDPTEPFEVPNLLDFNDRTFGGFPWTYSDGYPDAPWPPGKSDWLNMFWSGFARLAATLNPSARYYIEKAPGWLPGFVRKALPCETVYLFRDLRDVYLSSQLWGRTDAEYLRLESEDKTGEQAHMLAYEFMQSYENYAADRRAGDAYLVRYEDSISDAPGTVKRIEERFGLRLDLERSRRDWAGHATSSSLSASVGRWQKEGIDERAHRAFLTCVGRELQDLGYAVEDAPAPVFEFHFSSECMPEASFAESPDGHLYLESNQARVEISDAGYWLTLPIENFDAESIDHIWISVAQGPGNVCSLYWRRPGESFSEAESFHVEHQPSESWRVLDFPLNQHPEWRGKIEEVRLHLFNLYQNGFGRRLSFRAECRGTGYLRWLRAIKLS